MSRVIPVLLLSFLPALSACGPERSGEPPAGAAALTGVWAAEFTLESRLLPGHMPSELVIRGEVALLQKTALPRPAGFSGPPTHSGTHTARFRPFGFDAGGGDDVPTLVGRLAKGDSVEITLQPGRDDAVRMIGVLAGDSITGRWSYAPYRAGGASGSFLMRRR